MLEAHVTCSSEVSKLPRSIDKTDKRVKIDGNFYKLFIKKHQRVFGYNLAIEEGVSKNDNKGRVKRAERRLFKNYGAQAQSDLRVRL